MSEITVTLPDGSSRRVPAGSTPGEVAADDLSAAWRKRHWPRWSTTVWSICRIPLEQDARVRIVTPTEPGSAAPLPPQHGASAGGGGDEPVPRRAVRHRSRHRRGFFYDFVVERPFVPEDLEAIEKKMKELAAQDLPYERQMWPREEAKRFFAERGEPLKVQLIEEKTAGQAEVSCYTIKDRDTFVDFCVGPHVPSTGRLKAFKLLNTSNAYWKGDARNQPMQRIYGTAFFSDDGAEGAPAADRGGQEARPPQARHASSGCSCSTRGRRARRSGSPRARRSTTCSANYMRERAVAGRLRRGQDAAHLQQGAVGDVRPLAALPREHVPRRGPRGRADGPQGR